MPEVKHSLTIFQKQFSSLDRILIIVLKKRAPELTKTYQVQRNFCSEYMTLSDSNSKMLKVEYLLRYMI